jgi:hypothetical protein
MIEGIEAESAAPRQAVAGNVSGRRAALRSSIASPAACLAA